MHIFNCNASLQGGGIKALGEGSLSMATSSIAECSAWQGGGVFLGGVTLGDISASQITGNTSGDRGGGVHVSTCDSISFVGVSMNGNRVSGVYREGGALYANYSRVRMEDSDFFGNSAAGGGGCMFEDCTGAEILGSRICGNSATYSTAAAMFISTPNSQVSECTVAYNACTIPYGNDQGALFFASCAFGIATNNIIAYNSGDCGIGDAAWATKLLATMSMATKWGATAKISRT